MHIYVSIFIPPISLWALQDRFSFLRIFILAWIFENEKGGSVFPDASYLRACHFLSFFSSFAKAIGPNMIPAGKIIAEATIRIYLNLFLLTTVAVALIEIAAFLVFFAVLSLMFFIIFFKINPLMLE